MHYRSSRCHSMLFCPPTGCLNLFWMSLISFLVFSMRVVSCSEVGFWVLSGWRRCSSQGCSSWESFFSKSPLARTGLTVYRRHSIIEHSQQVYTWNSCWTIICFRNLKSLSVVNVVDGSPPARYQSWWIFYGGLGLATVQNLDGKPRNWQENLVPNAEQFHRSKSLYCCASSDLYFK